jgi:hypothetical protein
MNFTMSILLVGSFVVVSPTLVDDKIALNLGGGFKRYGSMYDACLGFLLTTIACTAPLARKP